MDKRALGTDMATNTETRSSEANRNGSNEAKGGGGEYEKGEKKTTRRGNKCFQLCTARDIKKVKRTRDSSMKTPLKVR